MPFTRPIGIMRRKASRLRFLAGFTFLGYTLISSISYSDSNVDLLHILLRPGDNVSEIIQSAKEGTTFRFSPGIYRLQSITPKNNQHLIGQAGSILSGAVIIAEWRREDNYWIARAAQKRLPPHGECEDDKPLCMFREDLFVDGVLYQPVASKNQVGPGKWYRDDESVVLSDNPKGRLVEMSSLPWAIGGAAKGVTLERLIVEKYATSAQYAAVDGRDGENWKILNVIARWNHGVGLHLGKGMHVRGGSYSNNGQLGIGGEGDGATIDGAEIAANNYAGFSADWEAGGTKFVRSEKLEVRNTCVHDNMGPGLWSDIDNVDITYKNNKVFRNTGDGIKHEISYRAWVLGNVVAANGRGKDAWLWGSQILIQNSSNVEVRNNIVEVEKGFGNGISIISQDRGVGKLGEYKSKGNSIFDNTIIHLGKRGHSGIVVDANIDEFWKSNNNIFDRNTYVLAVPKTSIFGFNNDFGSWAEARAKGYEVHGILTVEKRAPLALSCDK